MSTLFRRLAVAVALTAAVAIVAGPGSLPVAASSHPAAPARSDSLSRATVKALQEALNKQGIAVKTDGVLDEETRAAIKKYQSEHHLPVTGEADKATLEKLGVTAARQGNAAPLGQGTTGTGQGMMGGGKSMPKQ